MPEADRTARAAGQPLYDYFRSPGLPFAEIVEAANLASAANATDLETLKGFLRHSDSAIRYWGATGMLILKEDARSAIPELSVALNDNSTNVVAVAAETLYNLGETSEALKALGRIIAEPNEMAQCHALNVIANIQTDNPDIQSAVIDIVFSQPGAGREKYDLRMAKSLILKWGIDLQKHNITFEW